MAYKIQYSPESMQRYPLMKGHRQARWGRWLVAICVISISVWVRFKGIPDFLIPGDPATTRFAAAKMLSNVRAGKTIPDAFAVFCKEILNGALY